MKVKVIDEKCIGCGQCEAICNDVFKIEDDGISHVVGEVTEKLQDDVEMAVSSCPTDAIEIENA